VPYDQGEADIRSSRTVRGWPRTTNDKVPSEISYSATLEQSYQWGFNIDSDSQKMIWTKMELDQQGRQQELQWILDALIGMNNLDIHEIRRTNGLPSYPAKEPVEIVADYLSRVRAELITELNERHGSAVLAIMVIDLVVTVPAVR
jgi:hypothetical protein